MLLYAIIASLETTYRSIQEGYVALKECFLKTDSEEDEFESDPDAISPGNLKDAPIRPEIPSLDWVEPPQKVEVEAKVEAK